jgi:hypothetical protein
VDNNSSDKSWVKILVPKGVELDGDLSDGEWNKAEGFVKWNVKQGIGANVFHLNLKVLEDVGGQVTLGCSFEIEGKSEVKGKDVIIDIRTETHQPVFNGYPDGTFRPKSSMTRAEAATIIARELDLTDRSMAKSFTDVPKSHWARPYIEKAAAAGYMVGDGERFRPEDPVTLGEWIAIMLRMKGIRSVEITDDPASKWKGKWYAKDADTASALGYFVPKSEMNYDAAIAREVVAKLFAISLYRGELTDGKNKVIQHWPDVPKTSPYFGWIEELSLLSHESEQKGGLQEALVRYLPEQTEPF